MTAPTPSEQTVQPTTALHQRLSGVCESLWPVLNETWQRRGGRPASDALVSLEVVAAIPSTNTALMQRARSGDTAPTLMVALDQTAGRGRMGKTWHSTPGDSLTFSLGLPFAPRQWSGLSLAVGVAVAQGLNTLLGTRGAEAAVRLKWPNDLWLGEAKLAGILVEAAHVGGRRHAVVGVGINIRPPRWTSATPPAPLPPTPVAGAPLALPPMPPAHLQAVCPDVDAADALHAVAPPLLEALLTFEQHGFAPFQSAFAALDALRGRDVVLSDGVCGVAEGVNAAGECLVRTEQGVQAVASAELSVRSASLLGPTGARAC